MLNLDKRLSMVASLVRPGHILCDIGTDHAYLPVYLIQNNIIPKAFAGDLREGPLENAKTTVSKYGLEDRITLVLSNGLTQFKDCYLTDFVIAGMGGNLISDILKDSPFVNVKNNHFVFQPQSHAEDLREYLYNTGFEIIKEAAVKDGKHIYIAIEAEFNESPKTLPIIPRWKYYVGEMSHSDSSCAKEWLQYVITRLETRKNAIKNMESSKREVMELEEIIENIEREIREEF